MTEEILALALRLGGREENEEVLRALCRAAEAELARRLRAGVNPEDCGEAFPLAAAYWALAGLCAAGQQGTVESFTAGDVTIRRGSGGSAAQQADALREQAERLLSPWAEDGGFCFQKVMG